MRVYNSLTDDDGVKWEFHYVENMFVPVFDVLGQPVLDGEGKPRMTSTVTELTYQLPGGEPQKLPPWADIKEEWKINLCFFDEDEETEEMTFWEVSS